MQSKLNNYIFLIYSSLLLIFFLIIGGGPVTNDEIKFIYFKFQHLPLDLIGRLGIYLTKTCFIFKFNPIFFINFTIDKISFINFFIIKIIFQIN